MIEQWIVDFFGPELSKLVFFFVGLIIMVGFILGFIKFGEWLDKR